MKPASNPSPGSHAPEKGPWISVARLMRPQGRRGELLADPQTDLSAIFTNGQAFRMASPSSEASFSPASAPLVTLEDCWRPQGRNAGRLVLKLAGVDSITEAEALQGKELFLPEIDLPALDADTYLVRDLVGCSFYDADRLMGQIVDLQFPIGPDGHTRLPDAADLLVIEPADKAPDAEPILVPFVKAWLTSVDLASKRITMDLPEGLFDEAEEISRDEDTDSEH